THEADRARIGVRIPQISGASLVTLDLIRRGAGLVQGKCQRGADQVITHGIYRKPRWALMEMLRALPCRRQRGRLVRRRSGQHSIDDASVTPRPGPRQSSARCATYDA